MSTVIMGCFRGLLLSCTLVSIAFAESWTCGQASLTRQVLIVYPNEPARVPCQVYYAKPDEQVVPRVLWDAKNTHGYCERKAQGFVSKLESLGWQCGADAPENSQTVHGQD